MQNQDMDLVRLRALLDQTVERGEERLPPEPKLSDELGVSRGRLRTLLKKLESEGTIWRHVGKGTFVGPRKLVEPSRIDGSFSVDDLLEARFALEPELARRAAMHCTTEDVAAMETCLEEMGKAPSMLHWKRLDERLHRTIAQATHNSVLLILYDTLRGHIRDTLDRRMDQVFGTAAGPKVETEAEHFAMVQAICNHDPIAAEATMRNHLRSVRDRLFGLL